MPKKSDKKTIILFDAHAIIHRAYHALPEFSSSKGNPTGALYGLSTMLMSIMKEFKPDYMLAAFDLPKPTYRHEAYADYKSGRKALDENLSKQLKTSRDVFKAFNIPIYEAEGFEADDVIGTAVEQLSKDKNNEVIIASGDMDTMQLVKGKQVKVFTLKKGIKDTILYDQAAVKDRFSFDPKYLIDYKGLRGDPSDNIIGIQGVGEKTATILISNFGTIEKIYKVLDQKNGEEKMQEVGIKPRIINLLRENREEAEFSKMLATIRRDAPVEIKLSKKKWIDEVERDNIFKLFQDLEFRTLGQRLSQVFGESAEEFEEAKEKEEKKYDPILEKETSIMLWVLNSNQTNPSAQDVLHYTKTNSLEDAKKYLESELKKQNLFKVYEDIEKPLIPILEKMHENGILIDTKILKDLSKEYHTELDKIIKDIYKLANQEEEFNIASPKQLAEVLFVKMGLKYKGMRKTSSGSYSTKEDVLKKLSDEGHEIADKILEHRELSKLLNTYIDKIPEYLGKDGRLHTTYLQNGAATGRMASIDPNMQNIPIKTSHGRRIRNAFVAPKGKRLLAIDYSQIELRLAAILSDDEKLIKSFKDGDDIHASVASYVFDVPQDKVDKAMRVKAKTINFGILYGMGVSALQKNLKTDRKEAQKFYDDYFNTFKELANYLENTKLEARKNGYTETMFGRKRYFDGINSSLPFIRAQAERMAINAPIQGSQADIIKIAMKEVFEYVEKEARSKNGLKLLLQIHDELVFEVDEDFVEESSNKIKEIMEGVLDKSQTKDVPIIAESQSGKSWGDMTNL